MQLENLQEGRYYHIYNRGINKQNIFVEKKNYDYFLRKMKEYLLSVCDVYSYCLLPNHFHMVVQIKTFNELPGRYQISPELLHKPFSNLFNSYSKSVNSLYNRTGSLFQRRFHRNIIDSEEYLRDVIIYTHLNPVNHSISVDYKTYRYSSYLAISGTKQTCIKRKEVLELFDTCENFIYCHDERRIINEARIFELGDTD